MVNGKPESMQCFSKTYLSICWYLKGDGIVIHRILFGLKQSIMQLSSNNDKLLTQTLMHTLVKFPSKLLTQKILLFVGAHLSDNVVIIKKAALEDKTVLSKPWVGSDHLGNLIRK